MNNCSNSSMVGNNYTYVWDSSSDPLIWNSITWKVPSTSKPQIRHRLTYIIATCKQDEEPCVLAIYPEKSCFALLIHPLFSNNDTTWVFNTPELAYRFIEEQAGLGKFTELRCLIEPEELKNRMVLDKARPQKEE